MWAAALHEKSAGSVKWFHPLLRQCKILPSAMGVRVAVNSSLPMVYLPKTEVVRSMLS